MKLLKLYDFTVPELNKFREYGYKEFIFHETEQADE